MKKFKGIVTSTKMEKTAVVKVDRLYSHSLYKKILKRSKKYLCHDEIGVSKGEKVLIQVVRPLSRRKRFKIVKLIKNKQ